MTDFDQALEHLREIERRTAEYQQEFSFDGYKTVRKELFAHQRDPAITIRNDSVTFNTACVNGLESVLYVKIHINDIAKRIVITPSNRDDKNALRWCSTKMEKRISRKIIGKLFSERVYKLMNWDNNRRYKSMGFKIIVNPEGMIGYLFDLNLTESFENIKRSRRKKGIPEAFEINNIPQNQKINAKQVPLFSEAITSSFGDPTTETDDLFNLVNLEGYTTVSNVDQ